MPYTLGCSPAPLTFTIRPRFGWQSAVSIAWFGFVVYAVISGGRSKIHSNDLFEIVLYALISFSVIVSFIRRERIEIYPDQMVWCKTYFGFTRSNAARLSDVRGAEWNQGQDEERQHKGPDYVELFHTTGSVKACYGFTFDDFDRMRNDIRSVYPDVIRRWGQSTPRSKTLTLLNLS
jgi:hypothetical protein